MGENAQKIGKKLESYSWKLFDTLAWIEKFRDKEIECQRATHKNTKGTEKKTHGVDIYLEHEDPYINKIQGVFVECKNRQWDGINRSNIEDWVTELVNTMECAGYNNELQEYYHQDSDKNCGLLLINANDGKFEKDKFYNYLRQLTIKSKRMPFKVFIAGNDMINKWWSIENINSTDYDKSLQYIYPSINNSRPLKNNALSINQLFSKYIFAEYDYIENELIKGKSMSYPEKKIVVLCFDEISCDSFNYLWSMCRFYQSETNYTKFDICFYPSDSYDVDYIRDNFMKTLSRYEGGISPDIIKGINFKIMQNRELSVVENG